MGDTALNVPVKVRSHELQQMKTMMPNVADSLRSAELDEAAEQVTRVYDEHVSGIERKFTEDDQDFAAYVSMPAEDWRITMRYLNRARQTDGKLRAWWLQSKLIERVEEKLTEMEE